MLTVDTPIFEVYYAVTCEPCQRELPALDLAARVTRLVIYVLGDSDKAQLRLKKLSAYANFIPDDNVRQYLRQAGDAEGILPYSRVLTANGAVCGSWRGILTHERIRVMISSCGSSTQHLP